MPPRTPDPEHYPHAALAGVKVLLTGGTGFVGRHLVPVLVAAGAQVTCLVRPTSDTSLLPPGVRAASANLLTGAGLAEAVAGQEVVLHLAAVLFGQDWQDYLRGNALAAQHLGAALAASPTLRRCVHVSSLAASAPSACGVPDDVTPAPVSAYGWSKFLAEQCLGRALGDRLVVLRPPIIYGSGDKGLLPWFQAARRGLVITPGWRRAFPVSMIHAHDVVRAILCCCLPEAHGVYHCSDGHTHDMGHVGLLIAQLLGRSSAHHIGLPLPLMGLAAALASGFARLVRRPGGRAPSWNLDKYREARQVGWVCTGERIRVELGFAPRVDLASGLAEAIEGYTLLGWLPGAA